MLNIQSSFQISIHLYCVKLQSFVMPSLLDSLYPELLLLQITFIHFVQTVFIHISLIDLLVG